MRHFRNSIFRLLAVAGCIFISVQFGLISAAEAEGRKELLLFGANWCAPCRAELRDLGDLADAIRPHRLVVAWIDGPPRVRTDNLPPNVEIVDQVAAQALIGQFGESAAGLPLAILRDERKQVCTVVKRRLRPVELARLESRCPR